MRESSIWWGRLLGFVVGSVVGFFLPFVLGSVFGSSGSYEEAIPYFCVMMPTFPFLGAYVGGLVWRRAFPPAGDAAQ